MPKVEGLSFKNDDDVGKIKRGLGWPTGQTLSTIFTVLIVFTTYIVFMFILYIFIS